MIELNSFYPSSLSSLLLLYQTVHWKRKGLFKDTLLIEFTVNRCADHHQSSQAKITKDVAQFDPGCRSERDKRYAKTRSRFAPGRTRVSNGVNKFWGKPRLKLIRVEPGLNSQKRTSFNRSFNILEHVLSYQQADIRMRSHGLRQLVDDKLQVFNRLVASWFWKLLIHRMAASCFSKL